MQKQIDFVRECDCWMQKIAFENSSETQKCRCPYETNTGTNKGTQSGNQGSEPGETER